MAIRLFQIVSKMYTQIIQNYTREFLERKLQEIRDLKQPKMISTNGFLFIILMKYADE